MQQYLALATVLLLGACDKEREAAPAVDTAPVLAPLPVDSLRSMPNDSIMVRDTASP